MTRRLAEVAAKVGVSTATVSRVLNGKQGVSEPTRQAVLTALDVLGYERPTQLRGERSRLVGLVVPELQNPIFPAFAEVAGGALVQQGFTPVLCTQTVGGVQEADYVELMLQRQASGMLFIGGLYALQDSPHGHYAQLSERKLPTVLVNAAVDGLAFPRVSCDDAVAVEQSIAHLRHLGHSKIGLILGVPDHMPSRRRFAAAKAMVGKDGFVLGDDRVVHSLFSVEGGQAAAAVLIERGMTALICARRMHATGGVQCQRVAQTKGGSVHRQTVRGDGQCRRAAAFLQGVGMYTRARDGEDRLQLLAWAQDELVATFHIGLRGLRVVVADQPISVVAKGDTAIAVHILPRINRPCAQAETAKRAAGIKAGLIGQHMFR
ncbi:MAG: LacI family DNA-binding transcriptional regulator [Jatrophihabitantaceae bacterium]